MIFSAPVLVIRSLTVWFPRTSSYPHHEDNCYLQAVQPIGNASAHSMARATYEGLAYHKDRRYCSLSATMLVRMVGAIIISGQNCTPPLYREDIGPGVNETSPLYPGTRFQEKSPNVGIPYHVFFLNEETHLVRLEIQGTQGPLYSPVNERYHE
ncbi:hypothetical protein EDD18DRAFT_1112623 [Armillaria luteobubalina]|uniref:Uncharacterized protein n=1 Tax=Armillaria luteobubalina TaxID=153913 RepID=A0AA39PDC1_9AGAR|nr:hypothetical protein EDD18DRAFT_1112623 [Armillaria luteobubalina]